MDGNSFNIEGYEVISKIGQGGTSEVFLAIQKSLNRKVVLKRILNEDKNIDRLKKEGNILAKLNHKNIVIIHDFIESEDSNYIVEEYIQGASLDEIIKEYKKNNKHFNQYEFAKIALQILDGVKKAHDAGIIHRDLKPGNILIDADNNVKICDFGISSIKGNISTKTLNYLMGTIEYMPPELFDEKPKISQLGDIYSLGCIFYEMINLTKPFSVSSDMNILSVIKKKTSIVPDFTVNAPEWFYPYNSDFSKMLALTPEGRRGIMKIVYDLLTEMKNNYPKSLDNEYSSSVTDTIIKSNFRKFIEAKKPVTSIKKFKLTDKKNLIYSGYISIVIAVTLTVGMILRWPTKIWVYIDIFIIIICSILGYINIANREKKGYFYFITAGIIAFGLLTYQRLAGWQILNIINIGLNIYLFIHYRKTYKK